ncbi:MAG: hypothetical protein QXT86_08885 [Archaeoglobaceae archaeon]
MPVYLPSNVLVDLLEKEVYIKKLSAQKRRFVEVFCTTLSTEKTAKLLGWKVTKCYKLLRKPDVQKAIEYMQEIISFRNTITQDYFINELKKIIEDKQTKTRDKIDALSLLARITGHIREKTEVSATTVVLKQENLNVKPKLDQIYTTEEEEENTHEDFNF